MRLRAFQSVATCLFMIAAVRSHAIEPSYREIHISAAFGPSLSKGEWSTYMEDGTNLTFNVGVAVAPEVMVGLQADFGVYDNKVDDVGLMGALMTDNRWNRYTGGLYGEYLFGSRSFVPVLGASVGVHGFNIGYDEAVSGAKGQGDYGVGYGVSGGLRYRGHTRWSIDLRVEAENAPSLLDGWFYQLGIGFSTYL